ncbi:putative DNA-binding domain-containing protein [Oricola sp.]|uniref:HvfC/BufC family peptide modification chaperone n=1 Tax=Oricola sp. TaxID=1979950 RepID=UPI003BA8A4E9
MPPQSDPGQLDAKGFRAAILDPEVEKPATVVGPGGKQAVKRFNVYRNNVTVSLINSLVDIFPAVQRIAGETFFRNMAREFVRAHPPASPLLFQYGHEFPDFIAQFEPAARMPYLADVARLERCWLTAYHAADLEPLSPQELSEFAQERLGELRFIAHPAAGVVRSDYAVFDIFDANRNHETVPRIEAAQPQDVLITRPAHDVMVTRLPDGHGAFFDTLLAGATLADAAEAGATANDTFDIGEAIGGLLSTGAFTTATIENH